MTQELNYQEMNSERLGDKARKFADEKTGIKEVRKEMRRIEYNTLKQKIISEAKQGNYLYEFADTAINGFISEIHPIDERTVKVINSCLRRFAQKEHLELNIKKAEKSNNIHLLDYQFSWDY